MKTEDFLFEIACPNCEGSGEAKGELRCSGPPPVQTCSACDGHGKQLTELGEKVLDLVHRRIVIDINTKVH